MLLISLYKMNSLDDLHITCTQGMQPQAAERDQVRTSATAKGTHTLMPLARTATVARPVIQSRACAARQAEAWIAYLAASTKQITHRQVDAKFGAACTTNLCCITSAASQTPAERQVVQATLVWVALHWCVVLSRDLCKGTRVGCRVTTRHLRRSLRRQAFQLPSGASVSVANKEGWGHQEQQRVLPQLRRARRRRR